MRTRRSFAALFLVSVVAGSACGGQGDPGGGASDQVAMGAELFDQNCAVCHGSDLKGTRTGPPFLSPIYAPNHHPDEAFRSAVATGVTPHHWDFGPMPPIPALTDQEVDAIIAFVRHEQEEAGITEDPSHP